MNEQEKQNQGNGKQDKNLVKTSSDVASSSSPIPKKGDQGPRTSSNVGSFSDSFKRSSSKGSPWNQKKDSINEGLGSRDSEAKSSLANKLNNIRQKNAMNQIAQTTPKPNSKKKNADADSSEKNGNPLNEEGKEKEEGKAKEPGEISSKPNLLGGSEEEEQEGEEDSRPSFGLFGRRRRGFNFTGLFTGSIKRTFMIGVIVLGGILLIIILALAAFVVGSSDSQEPMENTSAILNGEEITTDSEEEAAFYARIQTIVNEYSGTTRESVAQALTAVYVITNRYDNNYSYEDMTEEEMRNLVSMMFPSDSTVYDPEYFKEQLATAYFPVKFPDRTESRYQSYAEQVISYIDNYNSLYEEEESGIAIAGAACTYSVDGRQMSNIQVRLMQAGSVAGHTCGGVYGQPMAEESLVDLEKYVLGVAYAEIGADVPEAAFKAQLIMARSFALDRPSVMNGTHGVEFVQEGGQWILQITNCVSDQVYCDPDQGCSKDVAANNQWGMVYSGANSHPNTYKEALPEDSIYRQWADEVVGKVVTDQSGNVMGTDFVGSTQNRVIELANQGYSYTDILVEIYGDIVIDSVDCTAPATGEFTEWKQTDEAWGSIVLGGGSDSSKSIRSIGCLATSISMLIMKSGALEMTPAPTLVNADTFNPGTFVEAMNQVGGFDSGGNLNWSAVSQVVPAFQKSASVTFARNATQERKLEIIRSYVNQSNTYCTAEVKGNTGQHWVAIDSISGDSIRMMDPGSTGTDMWATYDWRNTSRLECFTVQ